MGKLREQASKLTGRIIIGGAIATAVIGGGIRMADFDDSGNVIENRTFIAEDLLNIDLTSSGGVVQYDAAIVSNPLLAVDGTRGGTNAGSGVILYVMYQNIRNPKAVSHDICFVTGTLTATGATKSCVLQNTCTATGCISMAVLTLTSGVPDRQFLWNGADKLKAVTMGGVDTSFDARIRLKYADLAGE